ncbi:MAG: basic rane protein [Nocardioidaceae bacterium]|nr:basic rane protein [Nocardioidaceae bacterium]
MNRTARSLAVVAVVALALTACGSKPKTSTQSSHTPSPGGGGHSSSPPASNTSFKACMVSDTGGFSDKSFNQSSLQGVIDATHQYGISMAKIQSTSPSQYDSNINAMISAGCNIIITNGFDLGDATLKAAKANPKLDFAIVDFSYSKPPSNLKGLVFNTAQPAFIEGYLAAGMSKSGIVGTFGGQKLSTVTIYMDGFYDGVQYYNQQNSKNVQVIGWNEKTQNGTFTNDFSTKVKGQTTAQNMIQQGADVIFPVAGADGLGALQAAKDSGGKVTAIWVDTDGCVSAAEYCSVLLSSAEKGLAVSVQDAIKSALDKKFSNALFIGNLQNNGVGIAPYHDFDNKIPSALKSQLAKVKQDLISGKIKIASPSIPH